MTTTPQPSFPEPKLLRFEQSPPLLIAGLRERLVQNPAVQIPALWQRFAPHIGKIPGQVGAVAYGICLQSESPATGIDYVAGCAVTDASGLPADWARIS